MSDIRDSPHHFTIWSSRLVRPPFFPLFLATSELYVAKSTPCVTLSGLYGSPRSSWTLIRVVVVVAVVVVMVGMVVYGGVW